MKLGLRVSASHRENSYKYAKEARGDVIVRNVSSTLINVSKNTVSTNSFSKGILFALDLNVKSKCLFCNVCVPCDIILFPSKIKLKIEQYGAV